MGLPICIVKGLLVEIEEFGVLDFVSFFFWKGLTFGRLNLVKWNGRKERSWISEDECC